MIRTNSAPGGKECLLLGLLMGVTAMGATAILVLTPLVLATLLLKPTIDNGADGKRATWTGETVRVDELGDGSINQRRWHRLALGAALLFAGIGLGVSPCWIHNYFVARDPVFLSAHSGINFWIGNNPEANGYPRFPPGLRAGQAAMLSDSITAAETVAGHSLKRSEVSAYWSAKAKNYVVRHSGDWLNLLSLKLRNFWNVFQYDDLSIITNLREQGVLFPGLYFGLVAALAIPGMLLAWWLAPQSRWIIAAILLSMFALLAVFITERYRIVAVPGLLIFAAFGLSIFWQACAANRLSVTAIYMALLIGSTIFVSWPQHDPALWALDAYNSGWQALESNNLLLAEKKLALAYAYVPNNSETVFALGNLRLAQDHVQDAQSFYRAALRIDPQHKGALNNLGVISLRAGRLSEAQRFFEQALTQAPRDAKTHYLLAQTLLAKGDHDNAQLEIEQALKLGPQQHEFREFKDKIDLVTPR
jgi:Tfp pilus assembly protein PilF